MNSLSDSIKKLLLLQLLFLAFMSIFRLVFFCFFQELDSVAGYSGDIIRMFILGARIDLTVAGYIQVPPTVLLILVYYLKPDLLERLNSFFISYLFIMFSLVSLILISDFGFYSYFKEHINILVWGIIDDDTGALLQLFRQNYNVPLIVFLFFAYLCFLFKIISLVLRRQPKSKKISFLFRVPSLFFIIFLALNFLAIRGTLAMYPLGRMIPNISTSSYINKMTQNGVRSFIAACNIRKKSKKRDYRAECGFDSIEEALKIYKGSDDIDTGNLLNNITFMTGSNKNYNVVVIMVESFGMPILAYQSEDFHILGRLKKHFAEDVVFTNIISEGNGTIASLESLLLNIPYRPDSFPLAQSSQANTSFAFSPAFLYADSGYETTFLYGGDLSWRNFGSFARKQGYKNVFGKIDIYNSMNKPRQQDCFHPWGIYDEYLYDFIFHHLQQSPKKEFVLALSTNNHPPYNIPEHFTKKLSYSDDLRSHITGNFALARKRFLSYAYALDSVGAFLDQIKSSHLKKNTIVVITADNNTVEGIMKYDHRPLFTSKNIPVYLYLPAELKNRLCIDTTVAGSGKDIFPTLYNLTLNNKKYISIGVDLLNSRVRHYGFNGERIVTDGQKTVQLETLRDDKDAHSRYYRACIAITDFLLQQYK